MRELISFIGVGGSGAVVYILLSALLHAWGLEAWTASAIVYAALIPIVYLGQRHITFQSQAPHLSSFPKYVTVQLLALLLSALLPYALTTNGPVPAIASFVIVTLAVATMNFVLVKFWAFARQT